MAVPTSKQGWSPCEITKPLIRLVARRNHKSRISCEITNHNLQSMIDQITGPVKGLPRGRAGFSTRFTKKRAYTYVTHLLFLLLVSEDIITEFMEIDLAI